MDVYGLYAPPCGYCLKASMTRVHCRVLLVRIRITEDFGDWGTYMDVYG